MTSEMNAQLKVRYGDFINPLPSEDTMAKVAAWSQATRIGRSFNFPIYLGLPHGQKHNDDATAFTLATVIAPVSKEATLSGAEIAIRDNVSYSDLFTAQTAGDGNNGQAFMTASDYKVMGLMQSGELYRELAIMYGPGSTSTAAANIGVISSNVDSADLDPGTTVSITRATWIPGLWPLMTNALVDVYASDATTLRVSGVQVSNVSESNNSIDLYKSGSSYTPVAGDILLVYSAIDVSCYGLQSICANTGSLFGIDASAYPQWKVQSYSVGTAAIERLDITTIGSRMYTKGIKTGGTLKVSGPAFTDLAEEASELLRTTPDSNDVVTQGASKLVYRTACGNISVEAYPYMKQSIGMFYTNGIIKRVGATDLTFRNPMTKDDWFTTELADNAGTQLRIYYNAAVVVTQPDHMMYVTGIQSTADTLPA